jgi:hypothetical protein
VTHGTSCKLRYKLRLNISRRHMMVNPAAYYRLAKKRIYGNMQKDQDSYGHFPKWLGLCPHDGGMVSGFHPHRIVGFQLVGNGSIPASPSRTIHSLAAKF